MAVVDYKKLFLDTRKKYCVGLSYLKKKFRNNPSGLRKFVASSGKLIYATGPGFDKYYKQREILAFFLESARINIGRKKKCLVANLIWIDSEESYKNKFFLFLHEYGHYLSYLDSPKSVMDSLNTALIAYGKSKGKPISEEYKESIMLEELSAAMLGASFLDTLKVNKEVRQEFRKHQLKNMQIYFKDLYIFPKSFATIETVLERLNLIDKETLNNLINVEHP
jgi:hypothetical protein